MGNHPVGGARSDCRRHPPQPDAVRVPDPGAEGLACRQGRGGSAAGAYRCARLSCRDRGRHRCAWSRAAVDSGSGRRSRLGVPAAGPPDDHAAAFARGGDHGQPPWSVRAARARRRSAARRQFRDGRAGRVRRDALRRTFPRRCARGSARASAAPVRSRSLPRLGLVSACRSCCWLSLRGFGTGCRSPAGGWTGSSTFSRFRWA